MGFQLQGRFVAAAEVVAEMVVKVNDSIDSSSGSSFIDKSGGSDGSYGVSGEVGFL